MENSKQIFFAQNTTDVLYQIKNIPGLRLTGGCTALKELPEKSLCVRNVAELRLINHHERYIDFGPAVTLNEILDLDKNRIPKILHDACRSTANFFVRNSATIGGNICCAQERQGEQGGVKHTLWAPLLALDASLRFRNTENQTTSTVPLSKFSGVFEGNLLTAIRVPNNDWDISIFRRCGHKHFIDEDSASFCFLASTDKSVLVNVKIAMAGIFVFEDRELENRLLGARLPIDRRTIEEFTKDASDVFDKATEGIKFNPILRAQFLNLTKFSLNQLT